MMFPPPNCPSLSHVPPTTLLAGQPSLVGGHPSQSTTCSSKSPHDPRLARLRAYREPPFSFHGLPAPWSVNPCSLCRHCASEASRTNPVNLHCHPSSLNKEVELKFCIDLRFHLAANSQSQLHSAHLLTLSWIHAEVSHLSLQTEFFEAKRMPHATGCQRRHPTLPHFPTPC